MSQESPDVTIPQHAIDEPERLAAAMTSLVERAGRLTIHHVPGDPKHVQYLRHPNGEVKKIDTTPLPRRDMVNRVADLIALAKEAACVDSAVPSIYVYEDRIQLVWDENTGRDLTVMPLPSSTEWKFFIQRVATPTIDVKSFRRALETTLRQTFSDSKLVAKIGSLGTVTNANAAVKSERARESLGSGTMQEVADAVNLPAPTLTFSPLWINHPDMTGRLPLVVDIEPELASQQWYVMPREDSVRDFLARNTDILKQQFVDGLKAAGADVPVYVGLFVRGE